MIRWRSHIIALCTISAVQSNSGVPDSRIQLSQTIAADWFSRPSSRELVFETDRFLCFEKPILAHANLLGNSS